MPESTTGRRFTGDHRPCEPRATVAGTGSLSAKYRGAQIALAPRLTAYQEFVGDPQRWIHESLHFPAGPQRF
ncbi:MAG: hypothetical protein M5U19_11425 [Microthrixaceae bacterium]|nr:hypothetical protein [Microthrixaceae bacterium]